MVVMHFEIDILMIETNLKEKFIKADVWNVWFWVILQTELLQTKEGTS